jgi:hypothetical protein
MVPIHAKNQGPFLAVYSKDNLITETTLFMLADRVQI